MFIAGFNFGINHKKSRPENAERLLYIQEVFLFRVEICFRKGWFKIHLRGGSF